MSLSVHASAHAVAAHAKNHPNPAQQAKAADPAVKGADFGALVAQFAKARHAPDAPTTTTTTTTTPTTDTTPPVTPDTTEPVATPDAQA